MIRKLLNILFASFIEDVRQDGIYQAVIARILLLVILVWFTVQVIQAAFHAKF